MPVAGFGQGKLEEDILEALHVDVRGTDLYVCVEDDGVGGAEQREGSGLARLADRVGARAARCSSQVRATAARPWKRFCRARRNRRGLRAQDGDRVPRSCAHLLREPRNHGEPADDRQRLRLRAQPLAPRTACLPRCPPPHNPDDGARMGVRARLPLTSTPQRRPATLAQQLQPATTAQLHRDRPRSAAFTTSVGRTPSPLATNDQPMATPSVASSVLWLPSRVTTSTTATPAASAASASAVRVRSSFATDSERLRALAGDRGGHIREHTDSTQ
jgi:hypothetical protein